MADTMQIKSDSEYVAEVVKKYSKEIKKLHLRDTYSKPPGKGGIEFASLSNAFENFSGLLCREYNPEENKTKESKYKEFNDTVNFIFEVL